MKAGGKIAWIAFSMVAVVLGLGGLCFWLALKQHQIVELGYQRADEERQTLALALRARSVHLSVYKGLNWSSSGYDEKKVAALLGAQSAELDQVAAGLSTLYRDSLARGMTTVSTNAQALDALLKTYRGWVAKVVDMSTTDTATATMFMGSAETAFQELNGRLQEIVDTSRNGREAQVLAAQQSRRWFNAIFLGVLGVMALAVAFIARVMFRTVAKPVEGAVLKLDGGAERLLATAAQLGSAASTLAEGASEQAAALEETSSSLEEMASMTQRNAENAHKANEFARQARSAADAGAADMQAMNQAMQDIKSSSDEIGKIIKTIDEIAFQTNILALNAAVEAARAGEAGMGFAVVADEVRNLAQRCAQSAKETADKIEGAITKTAQGVELSAKVTQGLQEIVTQVRQVDELVAEVAAASKEQSQGITQVNTAVTQMDKVTQNNAANAEESASAAEELNAEAVALKEAVDQLMRLVGRQNSQAAAPVETGTRSRPAAARTSAGSTFTMPGPAAAGRRRERLEPARSRMPQLHADGATPPPSAGLLEWDPARMSTGVESVDTQHQELIARINRLHAACLAGVGRDELLKLLNFLGEYAQTHFRDEERLMKEQACPSYGANKAAHAQFLRDYERLQALVSREGPTTSVLLELRRMLGEWLRHHICTVDAGLRASVCRAE